MEPSRTASEEPPLSIFTDRRPLRQIGGLRAYLHQVAWSIWWRLEPRRGRRSVAAAAETGAARRQSPTPPARTRHRDH